MDVNPQPDHQIESFVSTTKAWHQSLTFDEPTTVRVVIEKLRGDAIYGYFVNDKDFSLLKQGKTNDAILDRIASQQLCEAEVGRADLEVTFPAGQVYVCIELDCQAAPNASGRSFDCRCSCRMSDFMLKPGLQQDR